VRERNWVEVAVPRPLSGRRIAVLWVAVVAVLVAGFLTFFAVDGPLFRRATAVVVNGSGGAVELAVFLAPGDRAAVHAGQDLFVLSGGFADGARLTITDVESRLVSPDDAADRFGLGVAAATVVTQPSVVAFAPFPPLHGRSPAEYVGGVYPAVIEIGRQPPGMVVYDAFTNRQVS
jgi:hypothetical protein